MHAVRRGSGALDLVLPVHAVRRFEGGVRVAAFASGGLVEHAARGSTSSELIHICDMWATFSALAGVAHAQDEGAAAYGVPPIDSVDVGASLTTLGGASGRHEVMVDLGTLVGPRFKIVVDEKTAGRRNIRIRGSGKNTSNGLSRHKHAQIYICVYGRTECGIPTARHSSLFCCLHPVCKRERHFPESVGAPVMIPPPHCWFGLVWFGSPRKAGGKNFWARRPHFSNSAMNRKANGAAAGARQALGVALPLRTGASTGQ